MKWWITIQWEQNIVNPALRIRDHTPGWEYSINIIHDILDQIFNMLDEEDISVKQIIPYLAILSVYQSHTTCNYRMPQQRMVYKSACYALCVFPWYSMPLLSKPKLLQIQDDSHDYGKIRWLGIFFNKVLFIFFRAHKIYKN